MAARILIVDDDANVQRVLTYTLRQEGYDVVQAKDGAEALRLWAADAPSLILLDTGIPKVDGYQVATRIRSEEGRASHVPIIMLAAETDVEHKVRGLRSGADDYLSKPFHSGELLVRIRSLLARFAPREADAESAATGRVHAFYGAKGGVGTTSLAINTAIALHRTLSRKAVLVDANLQFGDHRVFLDLGKDRRGIVDALSAPQMDADVLYQTVVKHDTGVSLLLAPPSPETADLVTPEGMSRVLQELRPMFDHVVVDCDRRLDEMTLQIFDNADTIFVVMTADLSSLKNVALVLDMARNLDYRPEKVQLLLNRSTAITGIDVRHAETVLKHHIDHEVVNEYRVAIASLNRGRPFVVEQSDSPLAKAVQDFARAIDQGVPVAEGRPSRSTARAGAQAAVKPG